MGSEIWCKKNTVLADPAKMIAKGAPYVIHNDKELEVYTNALFQLTALEDPSRAEVEAIELLTLLVERYEPAHYAIPDADAVSVVRFLIEQQGLTQRDLTPEPSSSDRRGRRRSKQSRSGRLSPLGLLEDACGAAGMQSVEYGRGYTCQFAYFRARWRESPFTRPGQNCSLSLSVSWTRGCLSATLREP
jgi:HTH-type transcriptional regulator/antitoxin HigA